VAVGAKGYGDRPRVPFLLSFPFAAKKWYLVFLIVLSSSLRSAKNDRAKSKAFASGKQENRIHNHEQCYFSIYANLERILAYGHPILLWSKIRIFFWFIPLFLTTASLLPPLSCTASIAHPPSHLPRETIRGIQAKAAISGHVTAAGSQPGHAKDQRTTGTPRNKRSTELEAERPSRRRESPWRDRKSRTAKEGMKYLESHIADSAGAAVHGSGTSRRSRSGFDAAGIKSSRPTLTQSGP